MTDMTYISKEIAEVSQRLGLHTTFLRRIEAIAIRDRVAARYGLDINLLSFAAYRQDQAAICDPNAWRLIGEFVADRPSFLIINNENSPEIWTISSGAELTALLAETIGFPFHVTDSTIDFLFYYDDDDC